MSTVSTEGDRVAEARIDRPAAHYSAWAVTALAAFAVMLPIWGIHRLSPRTLVSFHGMLHAGIVEVFLRPGGMAALPPENPFFAGEPVSYYWFFHLLAAWLVRLWGMNVFHAMEALTLLAAGGLVLVATGLGRKLYRSTLAGLMIAYLVVAGTNPLGVLIAAARVARNGPGILRDNPDHLWGVVHPLYSLIRFGDVGGVYGPLLNFYLNMTSRPVALTTLLLAALCLYRALRDRRVSWWLWLGLAMALTTAFSPIIGITAGAAFGVGFLVTWAGGRFSASASPGQITPLAIFAAGLAIAGGALLAAPTYYHLIVGPSSSDARLFLFTREGLKHLVAIGLSVLPLVAMAVYGQLRAPREARQYLGVMLLAGLALLALNVVITLPDGNGSNTFHAAVVLLAVPAAGVLLCDGTGAGVLACSRRRAAGILVAFLPTVLLLLASYLFRPPLPVAFGGAHIERTPPGSDRALLYRWVRGDTDPRAVFIIDPRHSVTVGGNIGEFPALTGRSVFTEELDHYMVAAYPDARTRTDLAVRLVSGGAPTSSDSAYLARLGRPVYLLSDASGDDVVPETFRSVFGPPAFRQGALSAYRVYGAIGSSTPEGRDDPSGPGE
jgi:hypothetical protein